MKALHIPKISSSRSRLSLIFLAVAGLLVPGCRVVRDTAELPGKTVSRMTQAGKLRPAAVDPVEVQQTLLRCANEFSSGMIVAVDKLRRGTNALDPAEALQWKIAICSETTAIASGPNALANLLDMTVFVTVTRQSVEDHWLPHVFLDSARPMLETCRGVETNLWLDAARLLTVSQQSELRSGIQNWRRQHPEPESVLAARAVGFTSHLARNNKSDPSNPASLFNLLMLDPFAGMDPAVREIAESRVFAERALFVAQQAPRLIRWQTELLTLNATRLPAITQFVAISGQFAASAEKFAGLAEQLPQIVNDQRTAAIQQIFDGLATERTNLISNIAADNLKLGTNLAELRYALLAGNELMKSSRTTIESLDRFMVRFDHGTNGPASVVNTNARPFDILDYAATAEEVTETLKELNATVQSLDKAAPKIQQASATWENMGNRLLVRLFLAAVSLILVLLLGAFFVGRALSRPSRRTLPQKQSPSTVSRLL